MTPTATATKATSKPSALDELKQLEAKWTKAESEATALSREHGRKLAQARELHDRRRKLIHREPGLVTHTGEPVHGDNEVALVDKAIADLGDLEDLAARVNHARQIEDKARKDWTEYAAVNVSAIFDELRPEAEAIAAEANAGFAEAAQIGGRYLDFVHRVMALIGTVHALRGTKVAGHDAIADLKRVAESVNLPAPLPEIEQ